MTESTHQQYRLNLRAPRKPRLAFPPCGGIRNVSGPCCICSHSTTRVDSWTHFPFDDSRIACGDCCSVCKSASADRDNLSRVENTPAPWGEYPPRARAFGSGAGAAHHAALEPLGYLCRPALRATDYALLSVGEGLLSMLLNLKDMGRAHRISPTDKAGTVPPAKFLRGRN